MPILKFTVISVIWIAICAFLVLMPIKSRTEIICSFQRQPNIAESEVQGVGRLTKVTLVGSLPDSPPKEDISSFNGTATLITNGGTAEAEARGSIFWQNDRVEGLFVTVSNSQFGRSIHLATLDKDGILEYNSSEAFVFTGPNDKLGHRLNFSCHTGRSYQHVVERVFSWATLALIGFGFLLFVLVFFAKRRADRLEF